jgi:hypothetical protein
MPSALRAQVALLGLFAVLLIPIGTSSLRGLTHILSCRAPSATPFSLEVPADGPPLISSSTVIERTPGGQLERGELCGGLTLDLRIGSRVKDRAEVTVAITNHTRLGWRGSVQLRLDNTRIPIAIGQVDPGDTAEDDLPLRLESDRTYSLEGTLLIGP